MIRRPPRSTLSSSSAASDVYKRQHQPLFMNSLHMRKTRPAAFRLTSLCQYQTPPPFLLHHPKNQLPYRVTKQRRWAVVGTAVFRLTSVYIISVIIYFPADAGE